MARKFIALLLLVVLAFSYTIAVAEKPMAELDHEFDQLMKIYKVYDNGFPIYPAESINEEFANAAETEFPVITDLESGRPYNGVPFLLTGTVVDVKGSTVYLKLDDGQTVSILFSYIGNDGYHEYSPMPLKRKQCNIYCIFEKYSIYSENPVLYAGATKKLQDIILSHTEINYGR